MKRQPRTPGFSFLFLLLVMVMCFSWIWQMDNQTPDLDYSQIRQQFEQERDFELRCEQRRMAGTQALLWQMNSLIDKLDAKEREIIIRRYVDGMRVEDVYKSLSISRATAFRRLEAGLLHMADLYRELFEQAA